MNRKELPREKKLKANINYLEIEVKELKTVNENQESNINYLTQQLRNTEDRLLEAVNTVNSQDKIISGYKKEFNRKNKLIDFLVDSKL